MQDLRCIKCNKLLAKVDAGNVQIKCPRCGTMNNKSAKSARPERHECLDKGREKGIKNRK